jgi:hypothetical protein
MKPLLPRYPIYIPSKGRSEQCFTADCLVKDGVPFRLVVEPQEQEKYRSKYGDRILVLPWNNPGSVIPARNWIKAHATKEGHKRHWQLDDNIRYLLRWYRSQRIPCNASIALRVAEDFTDRFTNVAIAGLEYSMFAFPYSEKGVPAFIRNTRVYSCSLVLNEIPYRWRGRYNEDTDICLQALAGGWCTLLVAAFLVLKVPTMTMKGGNTDALQYHNDGRLRMARALERMWPGVVETKRRFHRPQHRVVDQWRAFTTPLKLRKGLDLKKLPKTDEYGMVMNEVKPCRSELLLRLAKEFNA